MKTLKDGYKQDSRKIAETLKELQDELYDLKERCNDLYNRVVEITGHYMIMSCEQEEVGDHERK